MDTVFMQAPDGEVREVRSPSEELVQLMVAPDVLLLPMTVANPRKAWFYAAVCTIASVLGGILMDFLQIDALRALYLTAVLNGLVAPPLLVGIVVAIVG